jgi:surface antigen
MVVATLAIALSGLVAVPPPAAQAVVVGDDYPAYLGNAKQDALVDPWRFYNRECTSFVAWRLNSTNGVPFTNQYLGADLWWGNANTWGTSARAKGILVDNIPAVGSVAWSTAGKYGHVAWVAEVLDNGKIVVEEYNWGVNSVGEKGRYRERTTLASSFTGFIHIKDLKVWPPSDGAFIHVQETGEIYRMAGGAPVYVSDWGPFGGPKTTQNVSKAKFDTLPKVPKNGTHIRGQSTGDVYTIAHGAPIHVASWHGIGGEKSTIAVDDAAIRNAGAGGVWRFLRAEPADGFLRGGSSYRIFRVVDGRPYYVSSWGPYGGEQQYVSVDDSSIDGCDHLNCDPTGGIDSVTSGKGTLSVGGWAQDPNTTSPISVHVYVDGALAGVVPTSHGRADIERKFHRGITYGYTGTFSAKPGKREVCTYGINVGTGAHNTHLGCRAVTVAALGTFTTQPIPQIKGVTRVNETLTVTTGDWEPAASVALQWKANGNGISGAIGTSLRLTPDLVGKTITVVSTATLAGFTTAARTSPRTTPISPLAPYAAAPVPTVAGNAQVGSTLTATIGSWKPGATQSVLSWMRDGTAIPGATTARYVLTAADMGKNITFSATSSTRGYATTTRVSGPTSAVTGLKLTATPVPIIRGVAGIGQTITAVPGSWGPAPVSLGYQWLRNGVPIPDATKPAYAITPSDVNATLTVTVTGTKNGYTSISKTSVPTANVPVLVFTSVPLPTIAGTSRVGQTLTATLTGWAPAPSVTTYQWKRGGVAIPSATSKTYALTPRDSGQIITVTTNSAKAGYRSVIKTSLGSAKVSLAPLTTTPAPTIAGTIKVGETLSAKVGAWAPAPVALGYQWNRDGKPIAQATKNTYVLAAADKGTTVTVTVTGSKLGFATVGKTSPGLRPR